MNIKQKGVIASKSPNGDFGFITYDEDERIFFHISQTIEPLEENDVVLFESGQSRKDPDKSQASMCARHIHSLTVMTLRLRAT